MSRFSSSAQDSYWIRVFSHQLEGAKQEEGIQSVLKFTVVVKAELETPAQSEPPLTDLKS